MYNQTPKKIKSNTVVVLRKTNKIPALYSISWRSWKQSQYSKAEQYTAPQTRMTPSYKPTAKARFSLKTIVSKTFINTNVPIFRYRIASKTEARYETNRNQLERPFSSTVFWIDGKWNLLGPRRSSLDICFINTVHLSTWAIYKSRLIVGRRAIGGLSILRRIAKCTGRPNLKAAGNINVTNPPSNSTYLEYV